MHAHSAACPSGRVARPLALLAAFVGVVVVATAFAPPVAAGEARLTAVRFATPPAIDGDLTDWPAADDGQTARLDRREQVIPSRRDRWDGPDDLSGVVRAGADADSLYLAIEIRDEKAFHPGQPWWLGDGVEVFLDVTGGGTRKEGDLYDAGCWQIFLMPENPEHQWGVAYHGRAYRYDDGGLRGVRIGSHVTDGGVVIEASLPWNGLGLEGFAARDIGFNIALNDSDEGPGDPGTYLSWNGKGDLYRYPANFGVLHLPDRTRAQRTAMPAPSGGPDVGVLLLVLGLGIVGVALLAGPGAGYLARLGPLPKVMALGLTGLLALVATLDAQHVRTRAEGTVRTGLEALATEADEIAVAAAEVGALPPGSAARREAVLADLLRGARVPSVLPAETAGFVDLSKGTAPGGPYDLPLDRFRRLEIADPISTKDLSILLDVRALPARAQDTDAEPLGLARLRIVVADGPPVDWEVTVAAGLDGVVRLEAPIEEIVTPVALEWDPHPGAVHAVLQEVRAGDRLLVLAQATEDGIPAVGGPGSPPSERPLAEGDALDLPLPYVLGADRLWLVLAAPEAFPVRLGSDVAARVRIDYDEGDPTSMVLVNGEHVAAEHLPPGITRPPNMASRIAWRWTDAHGVVHTNDAVPIRLDPARRARHLAFRNEGGAGPLRLVAATVIRTSALSRDSPLGVTPAVGEGTDTVFALAPSPRFAAHLGRGAAGTVRVDRRVGPPERPTRLRLTAPLPTEVHEKEARTHILLIVCLAVSILLLAFLAADAVERFHRLTLRLAFAVLVAALVPLAAAVLLVDRTTARRLEAEATGRVRGALGSAASGLRDAVQRAQEAADHLSAHLARANAEGTTEDVGRMVRLYRAGAFPAAAVQHTLVSQADGPGFEIAGEDPFHSLVGPRFLAERARADGLHVSPWDGVVLVASARRGRVDRAVRVTLGARVDDAFLDEVTAGALPGPDAAAALLDASGAPLASAGPGGPSFLAALAARHTEIADVLDTSREAVLTTIGSRDGVERLAVVTRLPALAAGSEPAWLAIGMDRAALQQTLGEQRDQLAWLSLFGVLLIAGVAALTARRVADPVKALVHVTEAVRRGEFDVKVPPPGADEVGDLAIAFDQMRLDLKHRVGDLDFLRRAQDALQGSLDYTRRTETVLGLFTEAASPDAALLLDAASAAGPLVVVAEEGRSSRFTEREFRPAPGGWIEATLATDDAVVVDAPGRDERVEAEGALGARLVEDRPAWIALPLRVENEPVGLVVLAWDDPAGLPGAEGRRLLGPLAGTCALALHNARLYRLAALDELTRLPGATAFEAALRAEVEVAAGGGPPVTLLRIGLDHLDRVTRRRGVEPARELLRAVGRALRRIGGDVGRSGRLREDELAVRLAGTSREDAIATAEELCARLSRIEVAPEEGGEAVSTGVSIGVARAPDDATSLEFLLDAAERALAAARREGGGRVEDASRLDAGLVDLPPFEEGAVFRSERMVRVVEAARRAARTDAAVLLTGETGTGKEVVANLIHRRSARAEKPFVAVNCAAFPETLLESELFGHERGAFTGAERRREGRFELADTGTLFLDEVAEMAPTAQVKLLRVLQEQQFTRLGGTRPVRVDVRIIAATNRELEEAVGDGSFREDLYYRLNVIRLELPPLRERREEIPLFVERFLGDAARRAGRGPRRMSSTAMDLLYRHPWPGNVRELKNAIERAVVLCDDESIRPEHLRLDGMPNGNPIVPRAAPLDDLNERQRKLLDHLARHGRCTNREYYEMAGTSPRTGLRDLQDLIDRGLVVRDGKRRGAVYRLT